MRDGSALPPLHTILDILPPLDEWAVTSDGTLAIIRGHDYHVDWLLPNGEVVHSPKLPFAFKRLTDADKIALRDSATKSELAEDKARAEALVAKGGIRVSGPDGPLPNFNPPYVVPVVDSISLDKVADYYPPIRAGAVTADLDGNIWILPTASDLSRSGELVYDVVNRDRGLIARVRVPVGKSIAGFGVDGAIYLMTRDANGRWSVERTALQQKL